MKHPWNMPAIFGLSQKGTGSSSSSSSSSSSGTSTSPSNPCCKGWKFWASCNQKHQTKKVSVKCVVVKTTYYDKNGNIQAEVKLNDEITVSVSDKFKASAVKVTTETRDMSVYNVDAVFCPTNGKCNDCEEYRPKCDA